MLQGRQTAEPAPHARGAAGRRVDLETLTIRVSMLLIMAAFALQRFAIPLAGSFTSVVGPVGLTIAAYGMVRGAFSLDRRRLTLWFIFAGLALTGAAINMFQPPPFGVPLSYASGLQMLVVSSFATITFARPVDEERFFRAVNACFAVIATAGLLQFALQFVGLALFRFSDFVPAQYLTEQLTGGGYNNEIPITYGAHIFKSNGFFLAEPSCLSQLMAIAIAIELLFFKRPMFFMLYISGLLASASGTGWIVFAIFLATASLTMGRKYMLQVIAVVVAVGVALLIWSVILPDVFDAFVSRSGETSEVGSSGYIRFVGPWKIAGAVLSRAPLAALFGAGFGISERVPLPIEADINSPMKIALESGFPALICYIAMISVGQQTLRQARLVPAILSLLFITGSYAQFPPVLFPMVIILSGALLKPTDRSIVRDT